MKNTKYFWSILFLVSFFFCDTIKAQMSLSFSTQINTICNGNPCDYVGPSILINEVMLTPSSYDGSIYGTGPGMDSSSSMTQCWGEWIELYNPNVCKPADISCYYLGNNAPDNSTNYGGGFRIPSNTVVPPSGFVVIRGIHAPAVPSNLLVQNGGSTIEIVANNVAGNVCIDPGGYRLWFPNAGGWFAFYSDTGVPQDAISWNNQSNSCTSCLPCISAYSGCSNASSLLSYDNIPSNRKTYVTSSDPSVFAGESWGRIPDGGTWNSSANIPTMGKCNSTCNPIPVSSCNGQATVTVTGGVPPYSYLWDDPLTSITSTVIGLCAGHFCVTVTDANHNTAVGCVTITNLIPSVTFNSVPPICDNNTAINLAPYVSPSGGVFSGTGINSNNINPSVVGIGTHIVTYTYTDANTCKDTASQKITIYANPVASLSQTNNLCNGDSAGTATVTPTSGIPPYSYSWSNGDTTSLINNLTAGNYTVTISDSVGCNNTYSVKITQPSAILLSIAHTNVSDDYENNGSATVSVTGGTAPYTYQWDSGQNTPSIYNLAVGQYTVTVNDKNGCPDTVSVIIKVKETTTFYIPNAFTPNDDGLNDVFTPQGTNVDSTHFEMNIFDRWGNLIFHTTKWLGNNAEPWNGTLNNRGTINDVIMDTYVYKIIMKEIEGTEHEYIGRVTIIE